MSEAGSREYAAAFHPVAELASLSPGGCRSVAVLGREILLVRVGDEVFALADRCSHAAFPLEGGDLEGYAISCPLHGARFDVRDGSALSAPAFKSVDVYPVRIAAGRIEVAVAPPAWARP